jgi:hypothetical protein
MRIAAAGLVLGFAVLALLMLAPQRYAGMPLSERAVLSLLRLAGWIERTATAWDAAILRYRMEKEVTVIELESTRCRVRVVTLEL